MKFVVGASSIQGKRKRQEDACKAIYSLNGGVDGWDLFIVSDGMGGSPNGHEASRCAVEVFPAHFDSAAALESKFVVEGFSKYSAFVRRLEAAFRKTSDQVADTGGGATLSVLLRRASDHRMIAAFAGDSPIVRLRRLGLDKPVDLRSFVVEQQTEDHGIGPYIDRLVGRPTRGDPKVCLPEVVDWGPAKEDQWFVVMSDGVGGALVTEPMRARYRAMETEACRSMLNDLGSFESAFENGVRDGQKANACVDENLVDFVARRLCDTAVEIGSTDNCTAIVLAAA